MGPEGDDRILGIRAIGRDADGLVSAASIMIEQGLPYTYILDSIMAHPSIMECLQGAAHIVAGDALSYEEGEEFFFNYLVGDQGRITAGMKRSENQHGRPFYRLRKRSKGAPNFGGRTCVGWSGSPSSNSDREAR